ncbi:MAG: PD-(D/E)XK nuclease family protein [Candidatus Woesearchaeota archaeon]|nr:PD-(D/E)XK nuclease family protein [Candidatus Woesearchaeota archaeon]
MEKEFEKMKLYSYSRLETFKQCPLKFKLHYIDEVETEIEASVEAFLGSLVHETLEKLYIDLKFQKIDALNELLDFFNENWKKNWNDAIVIVRTEYNQENYKKMGEKFISDYYEKYSPFDQSRTIGLETKEHINLDDTEEYHIHIRIDRLSMAGEGIYEIHDYKTSSSLPTQEDVDADRQLAIYAYGIKKMYPDAKKIILIWHYLAFDRELRSERNEEQLENLRKEVLELIKDAEACTEFPPKMSALCSWCEFRPMCPNFKHLYSIEKKPAEEYLDDDGVKLVNKYSEVSEKIKELTDESENLKERLREFAERNNVNMIYGSGVRAFVKNYPRLSFPKKEDSNREEFVNTIKAIGLWEKIAIPDVYELAKMMNGNGMHPEIKAILEKYAEKGFTTYVRLNRSGSYY